MRVPLALAAALLFPGCAGVSMETLQGGDAPRAPHYEEHRALVAPQHDQRYPFEVAADASLVNVTLTLLPRSSGVAVPTAPGVPGAQTSAAPAELTVELLGPDGRALAAAEADPAHPQVVLLMREVPVPGAWVVRVHGTGAAGSVEGEDYGASYLLTIEVQSP